MEITCDMCGKPCRGQGTQGRGRNQRPATSAPRPTTPFIPNRNPGLVPHPIYPHSPKPTEAHTSQTNPTGPATSTPRPTTPFIPNRHPGLVPHPICLHSPICTQPTDTPRCPAPTRCPGLASAPLMRSKRRPPHPKHPTFAQCHRSGLHFGHIHPQHRQCGNSSKVYGDCHSVRGRRSLARHRKRRTKPHVNNLPHRHGEHRRDRRAWLRCPWAAAGPGRTTSRHAERRSQRGRLAGGPPPTGTGTPSSPAQQAGGPIHINHHDPTGVEGTGGTGGHGRASRRGTERSEVA